MFIRIRKERFGYILFERYTRDLHFVTTKEKLEPLGVSVLRKFLAQYYPCIPEDYRVEFINPPMNTLDLAAPIGMYLEISERCTLDCQHCYKVDGLRQKPMGLAGLKRLIQELHDIGVFEIRLCGNEPTCSPYFREICEYISNLNLFLGVNTNGFYGNDVQEELIALNPDFVVVSIDGDEKSHDEIRGTGSHVKAVSLLARISKANLPRRINTVISARTLDTIECTAQLANEFGADVSFLPFRAIGKHSGFSAACAIDKHQMKQAVEEIVRMRIRYPHITLLTYFDVLGDHATYHHSMDCNSPCPARKNGFITYGGDFYPCDFLRYLGEDYHCGNVKNAGLLPIWAASPKLTYFRNLKHDKCHRCEHYMTKCYGGCISGSIANSGCPDDDLCFIEIE